MSLAFFFSAFDLDSSATINTTEFGHYLETLRGDDTEHCNSTEEFFLAAGVVGDEANETQLAAVLAEATACVLEVTCGVDFEIEIGEELYECGGEHDHDEDEDHDHDDEDRRLADDHDHDEEEEEEEEVHLVINGVEYECEHVEDEDDDDDYEDYGATLWLKVLGLTFMTACLSLSGILLIYFNINSNSKGAAQGINLGLAFATGILLYLAFGHLIPEGAELIADDEEVGMWLVVGVVIGAFVEFLWPCVSESVLKKPESEIEEKKASTKEAIIAAEFGAADENKEEEDAEEDKKEGVEDVEAKAAPVDEDKDDVEVEEDREEVEARQNGEDDILDDDEVVEDKIAVVDPFRENGAKISNILIGDFLHNFVDGVLIALAFTICQGDTNLQLLVVVGIVAHEFPQELSDFLILTRCGLGFGTALFCNFLSSSSAMIGALIVLGLGDFSEYNQGIMLTLSSGILTFITLAELFPLVIANSGSNKGLMLAGLFFCGGVGLGFLLSILVPHEHCHAEGDDHDH